jgi:hypothetical protein
MVKYRRLQHLQARSSPAENARKISQVPVVFINLDRSWDRRRYMEHELVRSGLPVRRFAAVDGRDIKLRHTGGANAEGEFMYANQRFTFAILGFEDSLTKGQVGCLMSHLLLIQRAHTLRLKTLLVLEDDTSLCLVCMWPCFLSHIMEACPDPMWGMLQLLVDCSSPPEFRLGLPCGSAHTALQARDFFQRQPHHACAVANLWSDKGLSDVVSTFFETPTSITVSKDRLSQQSRPHADLALACATRSWGFCGFPMFLPHPQSVSGSTIDSLAATVHQFFLVRRMLRSVHV